MRVEVTTKISTKGRSGRGEGVEVLLIIRLVPRGGANRPVARKLAAEFREHPVFKPHITKISVGASKVVVHVIPSFKLMTDIMELQKRAREMQDVEGQLPLFARLA